ncbi:hypothetical protein GCM10025865_21650 [Paraoerskovia sediminicola]|uniref:Uncharacterized protein n=1 Tax=Paraoerskovia sediminicola TaxID=1138587 RepID=A0ABM8G444_9CELL|nr:hypothetical protein [Paraoerskovia sediminicola]BDZ42866.1 hypothetical protein GCM10025865_21650 [Paraoerskovia sediminicola]
MDYLRRYAPIGCRDWTTVDLLLSLGIPAFFSGCITTTVNTVFPELEQRPEPATVYVDVHHSEVPEGVEHVRQSYRAVKDKSFIENMNDAVDLLEGYRTRYTRAVTSRLHCYLPTTSLGLDVQFEPKSDADVRFSGLLRLSPTDFDAMRSRMRERLQPALTAIFEGRPEEEVYAIWSETVAQEVDAARARHTAQVPEAELPVTGREMAASATYEPALGDEDPDAVSVVLTPTDEELPLVGHVLRSAARATSKPLHAWVVTDSSDQVPVVEEFGSPWCAPPACRASPG